MVHNVGGSLYTSRYKPWALHVYVVFQEESKAIEFEKYLKSGSGKSFAKNHSPVISVRNDWQAIRYNRTYVISEKSLGFY